MPSEVMGRCPISLYQFTLIILVMNSTVLTRLHYYLSVLLKQLRHRPRLTTLLLSSLICTIFLLIFPPLLSPDFLPNLLHHLPLPLPTTHSLLSLPNPPPTTTCYNNPASNTPQETVCVHTPLCLSRSHQPYIHPATTTQCLSITDHAPYPNHDLTCESLLRNFSQSLPPNTAFGDPQPREWPFRALAHNNAARVKGTTLFLPMDHVDTFHVAKTVMRYLFAYSVIRNPKSFGIQHVDSVIVIAPKWQMDIYKGNGWVGGALRKILRDIGKVRVIVIGGKSKMFRELAEEGLLLDWTRKKQVVCLDTAVRVGTLVQRFSIPDVEKGAMNITLPAPLAWEAVDFPKDAFDYGERHGNIIYVRRSVKEHHRVFSSKGVEQRLMDALDRAAGFTGAKVQILEDDGAEKVAPFAEQISMVRDADVVIGIHGAGLTNAIFAPSSATLVELMPYKYDSRLYKSIEQSGVKYVKIEIATGNEYSNIKTFQTQPACLLDEKCAEFYRNQNVDLTDSDIFRIEKAVIRGVLRSQRSHSQEF